MTRIAHWPLVLAAAILFLLPGYAHASAWRFAVVGDTHVTTTQSAIPAEIVAALQKEGVSFVLVAGDLVEAGAGAALPSFRNQLDTWKTVFAPLWQSGIGVYPVRGNHEADVAGGTDTWKSAFSGSLAPPSDGPSGEEGLTWSFTFQNARIIGLDEYVNLHHPNQFWLDTRLAHDPSHPHIFVFGHEPAFKVFHTDCLGTDPTTRNTFWTSLAQAGAKIYFAGHDHFFDMARISDGDGQAGSDLWQVVAGTGGGTFFTSHAYNGSNSPYAPLGLFHEAQYGYVLVEISGTGAADLDVTLTWKHRTTNGDTVTYTPGYVLQYSLADTPAVFSYPVVDTGLSACYGNSAEIAPPAPGQDFYGQDAQYTRNAPAYTDNGDGTITDNVTGLMWVKERGSRMGWNAAMAGAASCSTGGYADWRVPTIRELYSLMKFTGAQGTSMTDPAGYIPFLDTGYFGFTYGSGSGSERIIDCQDWSATEYVSTTMNGAETVFGVNFADGRIKGYPKYLQGSGSGTENQLFVRYVRGNRGFGQNHFLDNQDGTVTDEATGLMWSQADSGTGMDWKTALAWVQAKNAQNHLGHSDWRMPNAKELQSIVDYDRSPDTTASAALDPVFSCTSIVNEGGRADFPFFWTSTSFRDGTPSAVPAAYICFGRALGWMQNPPNSGNYQLEDVHGAGAQRSDPKSGNAADYPHGRGPQGDVVRIANFVRLVRTCSLTTVPGDVDGSGGVDEPDANLLGDYLAENVPLPAAGLVAGDLDGDGTVSLQDLMLLLALLLP